MATKYRRQIATARRIITKKGTLCTWFKDSDTDTTDDTSPEFPTNDEPTAYLKVPIAFYPQTRQNLATVITVALTGSYTDQMFGVIPGDVGFVPESDDAVLLTYGDGTTRTLHVDTVNTTQPDLTPIVHEVSFK